jgi:hypothetical protein
MKLRGASAVAFGIATLLASLALTAGPAVGSSNGSKSFQYQHPLTTRVEVFDLRHIGGRGACPVAMRIYRYEISGHSIVDCRYGQDPHSPTLVIHRFRGWRLHLSSRGRFSMSRGPRSFALVDTDFPAPCG